MNAILEGLLTIDTYYIILQQKMCSWAFFKHTRLSVELLVIKLKMIRSNKLSLITGNDTDEEFIKPQLEN